MNKCIERLYNGIIKENPTFVLMLGMCPTLAVTTTAINGIGMGLSTTAVLVFSNLIISALRKIIPDRVRIPAYIVIVASLVTIVQLLLQAYVPSLYSALGIYIPLIVVNCIILGRAEAYAAKNGPIESAFDGIGMGLGFTVGLTCIAIVRELIGGVYFGNHETHTLENGEKQAIDSMPYSEHEIERIGRIGFETARKRRKKLCCVDKANVLDTSRLWRSVMHRLQAEYPDVAYSEMFVDNCAMQIVKNPAQFDVIVTENMFGDILSDEASMITGSIGMIPSSSLGDGTRGLYEPIHGSAPDIAGKDIVNPTACILSAAMMLRYSFGLAEEADAIENAVSKVLDKGIRTADNMSDGCTCVGCSGMGDAILAEI